jgi:hypothetical protein
VIVSVGSRERLTVSADENVIDDLDVGVSGSTLRIRVKSGVSISNATLSAGVTVASLEGIEAAGTARIRLADELRAAALTLVESGSSLIRGAIAGGKVEVDLQGASLAKLTGSANDLKANADSSSGLDGNGLAVGGLTIDLSGASSARLRIIRTLSARLSGSSSLIYRGSPRILRADVTGGSSLTHE